ncbi:MAG: GNAT family N-acetyltransferase [Aeromicrobium sp.]
MPLPERLTSRALESSDLDAVYRVGVAYDLDTVGEPNLDKADIEAYWKMPNFDLVNDSLGAFEGESLVAFAQVIMGKYIDVCVHPDFRGQGIGTALGQWSEDRLRDSGAAKAFQSAPAVDSGALELFAQRGYVKAWTSWVLALPADADIPRRELDEGYEVRPFVPGVEDEAAYEVVQVAFGEWPERERTPYEDWRAVVFDREGFSPDNLLVATLGDEVVGVCYVIDGERAGWVQNVAVDKAHRNHGIAQVLLAQAFEGTRSRGLERAELATDSRTGALGLYEKLGMHVTQSYEDWSLAL